MEFNQKEVVVIGNGIAAFGVVSKLLKHGVSPIVISPALGATYMFSGGYDIGNIESSGKYHPYKKMINPDKTIQETVQLLQNMDSSLRVSEKPLSVFTQYGGIKKTDILSFSSKLASIESIKEQTDEVGVAYLEMFRNFYSDKILLTLQKNEIKGVLPVEIHYLKRNHDAHFQNYDFAHLLEKKAAFERFITHLQKIVSQNRIKTLIFPPVLGVESFEENWSVIKKEVGIEIAETLSLVPSIVGVRVQKKIASFYKNSGVRVLSGKIIGYKKENKKIISLLTNKTEYSEIPISAAILATGKYIGGGIDLDSNFFESVFNLPLFYGDKKLDRGYYSQMFTENYFDKQPAYSIGVKINPMFQPIDSDYKIVFENLFAAGNIIQGYNYLNGDGGMVVAASTGVEAASNILNLIDLKGQKGESNEL
ncbi:hypothetical protein JXR93_09755 [bacterium]|nr:hypothetical protein [bacterium]